MKRHRTSTRIQRDKWDVLLTAAGFAMAGASVWFPWHVYLHPEQFGPPRIEFSGMLAENLRLAGVQDAPRAMIRSAGRFGTDDIVTGTVPPDGVRAPVETHPAAPDPFADETSDLKVLVVLDGQAVITHGRVTEVIKVGSHIPDGRTVVAISRTPTGSEVRVDDGTVFSAE